jgi:hypothetical protein
MLIIRQVTNSNVSDFSFFDSRVDQFAQSSVFSISSLRKATICHVRFLLARRSSIACYCSFLRFHVLWYCIF